MNETVNQEMNGTAPAQQENRTFSQDEVNAIVADRLTRERAKYADYDDLKAKAQQFDTTKAELDALTTANAQRDMKARVSAATGVPVELLTADTEEACTAQAQTVLKFTKPLNPYPNVRDGGDPYHIPPYDGGISASFSHGRKHTPKPFNPYGF